MLFHYQMANVKPDQADTYKCFATNEYGKAVVTVVLNVIQGEVVVLVVIKISFYLSATRQRNICLLNDPIGRFFSHWSFSTSSSHFSVGFKKDPKPAANEVGDFKTVLKRKRYIDNNNKKIVELCFLCLENAELFFVRSSKIRPKSEQTERKDGEVDPKFWEIGRAHV